MKRSALVLGCLISFGMAAPASAQFGDLLRNMKKELDKATQQKQAPAQESQPAPAPAKDTKAAEESQAREREEQRKAEAEKTRQAEREKAEAEKKKAVDAGSAQQAGEKRAALEKSQQFAKEAGVKWTLKSSKDAMTGVESGVASATFKTQDGALSADVRLTCVDKSPEVSFFINRLNVPTKFNGQQQTFYAEGRARMNEAMGEAAYAFNKASTNEFNLHILVDNKMQPKNLGAEDGLFIVYQPFFRNDSKLYVHTFMLELQTFKGPILAKIAALEPSVAAVLKNCQ